MKVESNSYGYGHCAIGGWFKLVSELQCKETYGTDATWSSPSYGAFALVVGGW